MLRMGKQPKEEPTPPPSSTGVNNQASSPSSSPLTDNSSLKQSYGDNNNNAYRPTDPTPSSNTTNGGNTISPATGTAPGTTPRGAVTESESLARDIKDGNLSGFVGGGTTVTGEATFKMMLRVDGHISGRVSSEDGTLIISAGGQVDANIDVAVALINGTVNGDIIATKRVEIGRVGKVIGNIQTPALIIENGALFEGSCRMLQVKADHDKKQVSQVLSNAPTNGAVAVKKVEAPATAEAAAS